MQVYFPKNIFTALIYNSLAPELTGVINFIPASLISKKLSENDNSIGLIPSFDLLKHKDYFVSKSFGISFENSLCNSYLYFQTHGKQIKDLGITGDVSSNEVIGCKLILKELYTTEINISLLTDSPGNSNNDLLVVGDENFISGKYNKAISLAEEIIEVISLPYVNFALASTNELLLLDFAPYTISLQAKIYDKVDNGEFGLNFTEEVKQYFKENISSFICNLDEQDVDGLDQLLRLPFYHDLIQEIIEIKFV